MGLFSKLFGSKGPNKTEEYLANGAVVIDVRNADEFAGGHVEGSKNIPVGAIGHKVNQIKKLKKPVILCCASGMRSGKATDILKREGIDAINGGRWKAVNRYFS